MTANWIGQTNGRMGRPYYLIWTVLWWTAFTNMFLPGAKLWRIHRRIGMSAGLLANNLLRETGRRITAKEAAQLQRVHAEAYAREVSQVRSLPGARELLSYLSKIAVPWAIATSGRIESAGPALKILGIGSEAPVVTRDQVERAKPDPDLFLAAGRASRGGDR